MGWRKEAENERWRERRKTHISEKRDQGKREGEWKVERRPKLLAASSPGCIVAGTRMRGRVRSARWHGGEEAGHGAVDINNNYWFEPLFVRDLSNLKITSEIYYVRLISLGPQSVYRRGYYANGGLFDRTRVCVLTLPATLVHFPPLFPSPSVFRGQVKLLAAPLPPLTSCPPLSYRIISSAPAHARISVIMWSTAPFTRAALQFLKLSSIFGVDHG